MRPVKPSMSQAGCAAVGIVLFLLFIGAVTHVKIIRPGTVGVKVKQYGSSRGVQKVALGPGMQILLPGEAKYATGACAPTKIRWRNTFSCATACSSA